MAAGRRDLKIEQYSLFSRTFTYKINGALQNLTGYTGSAQVRDNNGELLATLVVTFGGALGTITISLAAQYTQSPFSGKWDLLIKPPASDPFRFLQGSVDFDLGVTPLVA